MSQISQESNNQGNNSRTSNNASLHNVQWVDISPRQTENKVVNDFFRCVNKNQNLDEQLKNLIGQKDRVSQEIFCAGEKVYFCERCQLGYHEDSWQYLTLKCEQCKSSNVGVYSLPLTSVQLQEVITESFMINAEYVNVLDLHIIRSNIGETVSVKGKIIGAYIHQDNNTIYFDFAQNVSDGFFAYVPTSSFHNFENPSSYIGSNVAVFGRITLNSNNQLYIILNENWQLRRID